MKYDNNRYCNHFELTIIKLLFLITRGRRGYTEEEHTFLNTLEKELFPEEDD